MDILPTNTTPSKYKLLQLAEDHPHILLALVVILIAVIVIMYFSKTIVKKKRAMLADDDAEMDALIASINSKQKITTNKTA